jgi:chromosome segregation ATPase
VSATFTIGEAEYRRRRITRAVRIELEGIQDSIDDALDAMRGIDAELDHAEQRLGALSAAEGEFDRDARDALLERRRELRGRLRELNAELIDLQLRALALRLDPQPDPSVLDEHMDERERVELLGWLDQIESSAQDAG